MISKKHGKWVNVKLPDAWESPNVHDSTTFRDHLHRNGVHFVRTPNVGYNSCHCITHFLGGIKQYTCMVLLRDFPYNDVGLAI